MNCPNCGNTIPDDSGFCTFCGKPVAQASPQMQYAPPPPQYAPPQVQYAPPQNPYMPPQPPVRPEPGYRDGTVTMGEWFGYLVLMLIPICNIIMMFIFAFNPKIKPSKANLARLQLLLIAISIGISLTIGLIILATTGRFFGW